jgi:DNA-binding GntR family transcriptional regulator
MCVGRNLGSGMGRHQKLVLALSAGDAALAAESMREHIRHKQQDALNRLAPYFLLRKSTYTRSTKILPIT